MKLSRLICLLAATLIAGIPMKAAITVELGNGTASSSAAGPWNQLQANNKSKKVLLFTQGELAAQGIVPGVIIHAMKWFKTNNDQFTNGAYATGKLYMRAAGNATSYGNSNLNVLDYIDNGFTHVSTVNYNTWQSNIGLADWVGFTDFYYTYTGGALEVYVDWKTSTGNSSTTTTGDFQWKYSNTGSNKYLWYHGVPFNSSDFNVGNERPNTLMVFTVPSCTAAPTPGTVVSTVTGPLCQGNWFELDLIGNSTATSQTYTWQHATSANGPWSNFSVPLPLPIIGIGAPAVTTWYRAKVTCGSYVAYSDTVQVVVNPGLSGNTYTINNNQPTGGGNYHSFTEAISALGCGITGPVTFNVAPGSGPYNEQIVIPQIGGASILNTITINGNNALIRHTSVNPAERATVKLDGADYVTINQLTIEVNGATGNEYGYGLHIIHNANFNTINDCDINVNTTSSSNSSDKYAGIVINGDAQAPLGVNYADCDINIIKDNTITGGFYSVILSGNSESSTIMGNLVTNNTILDFYRYGIYAANNSTAIIEGNDISRPDRSSAGDFTGIQLAGYNESSLIMGNKIHDPFGADVESEMSVSGISVTGCNPGEGSEDIIANNVIYNFKTYGNQFGLRASGSSYVKFQHNTVSMEYENAVCDDCGAYGFYQDGAEVSNLDFSNNMISMNGEEEGTIRAMHFTNAVNGSTFNNNNYYLASGLDDAEIGAINGTSYNSLLLWKVGVLGDLLSISKAPIYQDPTSGNFRPTNQSFDNAGFPVAILIDANGTIRNLLTPDIGAYEFDENTLAITNRKAAVSSLDVYPNPATDIVNVGRTEKLTLTVSSIDGRVLLQQTNTNSIDMSSLASGMYILKASNKEGAVVLTEKIIKSSK